MEHQENKKVLTRQELFDLVWSTPMIDLGKTLNISDNGLRKVCRKYLIPVPKMGHWQKVRYGKTIPKKPTLPPLQGNDSIVIKMMPLIKDTLVPSQVISEPIVVPDHVSKFHPLVKQTRDIFLRNTKDDWGRHRAYRDDRALDIRVGPDQLSRASKIMDTIVRALESRGVKITIETQGEAKASMCANIDGEKVVFSLEESLRIVKITSQTSSYSPQKLVPSGALNLCIKGFVRDCQTKWSDGKSEKIEQKLTAFLNGLFFAAAYLKKSRQEREEERRQYETAEKERIRKLRAQEEEARRFQTLEQQAMSWQKSRLLRAFVRKAVKVKGAYAPESEFAQWVSWAIKYAETINPLSRIKATVASPE